MTRFSGTSLPVSRIGPPTQNKPTKKATARRKSNWVVPVIREDVPTFPNSGRYARRELPEKLRKAEIRFPGVTRNVPPTDRAGDVLARNSVEYRNPSTECARSGCDAASYDSKAMTVTHATATEVLPLTERFVNRVVQQLQERKIDTRDIQNFEKLHHLSLPSCPLNDFRGFLYMVSGTLMSRCIVYIL